jgi:hypothetical protein
MSVETIDAALGRSHRPDPVLAGSGGPAGNARLTAWTGLVLLVLFLAEGITLLDVRGLISWHLAIGAILIPPALLKTATTSWRIARYYTGHRSYTEAGPPPMALRVLGPLVVLSTLGLLGTGVALVLLGRDGSRLTLASVLGQRVDAVTVHQGAFIVWLVATGLHVLARVLPAWNQTWSSATRVPGRSWRALAAVGVLAASVVAGGVVLAHPGGWQQLQQFHLARPR